jgi:exo-beta-1,3-glucanase (GH17 family)
MSYTLPKYGVGFGDVDTTYTSADVKAAVETIANYYNLIRTYDNFGGGTKLSTLMDESAKNNIDVILGIPNVDLTKFDAGTYVKDNCYKSAGVPWPNLKCIIVGNETYGGAAYDTYAKDLHIHVAALVAEIKGHPKLNAQVAVSVDFGPALYMTSTPSDCDFTGGSGKLKATYLVQAIQAITSGGLGTPSMVFGNLYPFYAPETSINLTTADQMINQLAGKSEGWYPYTAALEALKNNGLEDVILNVGETGWSTKDGNNSQTQTTSEAQLTTYLAAYQTYIETPSTYSNINQFKGMTSIFFEMFDEPLKTDLPWEPYWGSYHSIDSGTGAAPAKKVGVTIPFTAS